MTTHDPIYEYDTEPDYDAEPVQLDPKEAQAFDLANWHLREIARIRRERDELVSNVEAEIARLRMRLGARVDTLERQERWHSTPLINLHAAIRRDDPKRASIVLACGTLRSRKAQASWTFNDEQFVEWAREHHPELLNPAQVITKVPAAQASTFAAAVHELTSTVLGDALPVVVSPVTIDKAKVKQTLVIRDAKNKPLHLGVDPATNEKPPGLTVEPEGYTFSIDFDDDVHDDGTA